MTFSIFTGAQVSGGREPSKSKTPTCPAHLLPLGQSHTKAKHNLGTISLGSEVGDQPRVRGKRRKGTPCAGEEVTPSLGLGR